MTCSREVTNMQERSNKCAGITCSREVTNMHCKRRKTYCRSKKTYLGGMFSYFVDDEKQFLSRYTCRNVRVFR
jgi:hypothetical protein